VYQPDRAEDLRCVFEDESALVFGEEGLNPCHKIGGDHPFGEDSSQLLGADIVKTTLDVQEKS